MPDIYHSHLIFRFYYLSFLFSASLSDLALCLHSASILRLARNKNFSVKNLKLALEWYNFKKNLKICRRVGGGSIKKRGI